MPKQNHRIILLIPAISVIEEVTRSNDHLTTLYIHYKESRLLLFFSPFFSPSFLIGRAIHVTAIASEFTKKKKKNRAEVGLLNSKKKKKKKKKKKEDEIHTESYIFDEHTWFLDSVGGGGVSLLFFHSTVEIERAMILYPRVIFGAGPSHASAPFLPPSKMVVICVWHVCGLSTNITHITTLLRLYIFTLV